MEPLDARRPLSLQRSQVPITLKGKLAKKSSNLHFGKFWASTLPGKGVSIWHATLGARWFGESTANFEDEWNVPNNLYKTLEDCK